MHEPHDSDIAAAQVIHGGGFGDEWDRNPDPPLALPQEASALTPVSHAPDSAPIDS